jgi:3-methylcrotonyl-CoA carboxylase alpha subunit
VRTNVRFLRWLLDQPAMTDGEVRTDTIGALNLPRAAEPTDAHWRAAAAALLPGDRSPWAGGWRLNGPSVLSLRHEGETRSVAAGSDSQVAVTAGSVAHVDVEGQSLEFAIAPPPSVDDARQAGAAEGGASTLTAPMPGRVVAVRVVEGERVARHAVVVVMEAMKMEHAVVAPIDGRVTRLSAAEGQQVQRGDVLAAIEPYDAADAGE